MLVLIELFVRSYLGVGVGIMGVGVGMGAGS